MKNNTQTLTTSPQKNGYEIRAKILELAQTQAFQPFMANMHNHVGKMMFPNEDEVLAIAEKFNSFVSGKSK